MDVTAPPAARLLRRDLPATLVAGGLALVLLAGVLAALLVPTDAEARTRLVDVRAAVVTGVDGVTRTARDGEPVLPGETVRTAADGAATLLTRDRRGYLGPGAAVTVLDGVRLVLDRGSIGLDVRSGPPVTLAVGSLAVRPSGVVRVDRDFATRVAAVTGRTTVTGSGASRLDLPVLHQVLVPARTLPREGTPLALTGDALDSRLAPGLVRADRVLRTLATGLDSGPVGPRLAAAVPVGYARASVARTGPLLGAAARTSEVALPLAIARVSRLGSTEEQRYAQVRVLRAQGGSWGVVAALVQAPVDQVGGAFDALLAVPGTGEGAALLAGGSVPALGAAPVPAGGAPAAGPGTTPAPPAGSPSGGPGAPVPSTPGTPPPSTPPTQDPGPLAQLLAVVGGLVPVPLPVVGSSATGSSATGATSPSVTAPSRAPVRTTAPAPAPEPTRAPAPTRAPTPAASPRPAASPTPTPAPLLPLPLPDPVTRLLDGLAGLPLD